MTVLEPNILNPFNRVLKVAQFTSGKYYLLKMLRENFLGEFCKVVIKITLKQHPLWFSLLLEHKWNLVIVARITLEHISNNSHILFELVTFFNNN